MHNVAASTERASMVDLRHPLAAVDASPPGLASPRGGPTPILGHRRHPTRNGSPIRVLLVEDDPADQKLVTRTLAAGRGAFAVEIVSDPLAARSAIVSGEHDAFLVDWNLDGRAGIDLISDLQARATGPMIAITRADSQLADRAAQRAGAFDFVSKDQISPELLARTIRYAVQAWSERHRFQDMFDQAPVGLFRSSPDGTIREANPALAAMLDVSDPTELLTRKATDFYADPDQRSQLVEALAHGHDTNDVEVEMVSATGRAFWASLRLRADRDDGEIEIYGSMSDVTERRRRDEQLLLREAMLDQAHHMVCATTIEGEVIFWNQYAEILVGWTADEAVGRSVRDLGLVDWVPDPDDPVAGGDWEAELVVRRKDGSSFPALVALSTVNDASGRPAARVTVVVDLSELRRAEELAIREHVMADSVLNSVDFPAAIVDKLGRIVAVNLAWDSVARRAGADPTSVGPGVNYLDVCDRSATADSKRIGAGLRSVLSRATSYYSAEYSMETPNGTAWFQADVSPVDQPVGGAVIMHVDITAVRSATHRAEELADSRIRLLASVSHQLRTPLTAILGFSQLRSTSGHAECLEFADIVAAQANEMAAIIDDLLVASRSEADQLVIAPESMLIDTEVKRVLNTIAPDHGKSIVIETGEARAWGDPIRTRQIIRNLISNAIRYGGEHIRVSASNGGDTMALRVSDDGAGIQPERARMIFEPFRTAHPSVGTPGSLAIGLPVARSLARVMGGDVVYDGHGGTTFELRLPAHSPA